MKIGRIFRAYDGTAPDAYGELVISGKDYLTKKVQILAKTGSGKSYTASKICEELLKEDLPICAIDPVSVYWSLKEKFKIIVFGDHRNKHADYGLVEDKDMIEPQAEMIADYVANSTDSVIIDLSRWPEYKQQKFGAAFATRLYLENKIPRHVFIEEADIFVPQTVNYPDEIASRHAFDTLIRRGRMQGIGATVISQRPAVVSKNILSQSDLSIYLHLKDSSDLEPARKEINNDEDLSKDEQTEIIKSIKALQKGNAFFYSPAWLHLKAFVEVGKKETYHAGATRGEPDFREDKDVELVPVDLATLESKLAELSTKHPAPEAAKTNAARGPKPKQEMLFFTAAEDLKIKDLEKQVAADAERIQNLGLMLDEKNAKIASLEQQLGGAIEERDQYKADLADFEALKIVLQKLVSKPKPDKPPVETVEAIANIASPENTEVLLAWKLIKRAIDEGVLKPGQYLRISTVQKAALRYGHKFKPAIIKETLESMARDNLVEIVVYGKQGKGANTFYKVKKSGQAEATTS